MRDRTMTEQYGDIFEQFADAICITTNGYVDRTGQCVMGRGNALHAKTLKPTLAYELGSLIRSGGNRVHYLGDINGVRLYSFPVKPATVTVKQDAENLVSHVRDRYRKGMRAPGWAARADIEIIRTSALQLRQIVDNEGFRKVFVPRPGVGAGELRWSDVCSVLEPIFDDRFVIIRQ
jgi:hypothetical protein